jgi:hypothetical protein
MLAINFFIMKHTSLLLTLLFATVAYAAPKAPQGPEPQVVFEKLKELGGTWRGHVGQEGSPAGIDYHVTAGGSVLLETIFPGTPKEMVSMYYMNRGELTLTQYCVAGNQPEMLYDRKHSTPDVFVFKFDGGRGFSMRDDVHIHDGTIKIADAQHFEATWNEWRQGKPAMEYRFVLTRAAKQP